MNLPKLDTLPDCTMPDGGAPCAGYVETHSKMLRYKAERAVLRGELTRWKARAQKLWSECRHHDSEMDPTFLHEAATWFDEDGVPKPALREEG